MLKTPTTISRRYGILAAGNWVIDHIKMIDAWPVQDALATIVKQAEGNGGGPYNILKGLAKLKCGFPLAGVGLVGTDPDGETIFCDCDAHGIDRGGMQATDGAPTSYTDVMTAMSSGRRTFFHQNGANAQLAAQHFDFSRSGARIFHLGYLCLLRELDAIDSEKRTGASRLFEQATSLGLITVADLVSSETSDFPAIVNPSLPYVDYLLLNEYELGRLAGGQSSKEPTRLISQAREVLTRGVQSAVVVHFPEGALCICSDGFLFRQPAVRVPSTMIAGTAGAGDAFGAGFLYGLHEGWKLQDCLELGVCVAAASLRDATCSNAIEPWKACLAFGRKLGFYTTLK
jgi:sugar/nucleoside kinase (ribokinase family)